MGIKKIIEGLNDSQKEAVLASDKAVLVVAGPGTGKTLTIVRRIAYLIEEGVNPCNIVALTFTNRAASELRERIKTFSEHTEGLFAGTFHLFGLKIIKDTTGDSFSILNREGQVEIIKNLCSKNPLKILEKISRIKNLLDEPEKDFEEILWQYQRVLAEKGLLDFDDLLLKAISLLSDEAFNYRYRASIRYLIVDEYQDINPLQFRFLKVLSPASIFAVGDPDQSVYAFRGANVKNFLDFEKDYPQAKRIVLDRNYRSQAFIVKASESVIEKNKERIKKRIIPVKEPVSPVKIVCVPDETGEVDFIVREIEKRLGGISHYSLMKGLPTSQGQNYGLSDFAVLGRTNSQIFQIESGLKKAGIPCFIMGRAFRDEVMTILSFIKENRDKPFETLLSELKNRHEVINSFLKNYEPSTTDDLINLLQLSGPEEDIFEAEGVKLMTMHMSKGLEFRIVFLTGLEEGIIPYREEEIEEERRLFYVAMTRAKEELFLIHTKKRNIHGRIMICEPSRFLKEIEEQHIERILIPQRPLKEKQLGLF